MPNLNESSPLQQQEKIGSTLLDIVTRFYEGIFTDYSIELMAEKILAEAARVFEADIATWFLVTEDREKLRLVDVYNDLGKTPRPPVQEYSLKWDATSEWEVKGLTAWTAISGKPLHVADVESLTKEHGQSHAGLWDDWLYPGQEGIHDPKSGFLCMYAVPLTLPNPGPPTKSVVGVLKMERRKMKDDRARVPFTPTDLEAFNIIAKTMGFAYSHSERQKSLTLADIGHVLIRPLGDVALSLDVVSALMSRPRSDPEGVRKLITSAVTMIRSLSRQLRLAKDSYNAPLDIAKVDVREELGRYMEAYTLTSNRRVVDRSVGQIVPISLKLRSWAALVNTATNLLENATRHAPMDSEVTVRVDRIGDDLVLRVENQGKVVPAQVVSEAKASPDSIPLFRGLPRSFQLAGQNGWGLNHTFDKGVNCFELVVPHAFVLEE